jgi:hypothetical protein
MPTLVDAMERQGHLQLEETVRALLLRMSAATIDRRLKTVRGEDLLDKAAQAPSQSHSATGDGQDVCRLGRRATRIHGDRPGDAQRTKGGRKLFIHWSLLMWRQVGPSSLRYRCVSRH